MPATAMPPRTAAPAPARASAGGMVWTGRVISGLVSLFFLMDGGGKLFRMAAHIEGSARVGFAAHLVPWIGLSLVVATILYLIPRTAVLGAILVTGYLGGAVATQVRLEDPWFLFPVLFGVLTWAGLYLRDPAIRALIPVREVR